MEALLSGRGAAFEILFSCVKQKFILPKVVLKDAFEGVPESPFPTFLLDPPPSRNVSPLTATHTTSFVYKLVPIFTKMYNLLDFRTQNLLDIFRLQIAQQMLQQQLGNKLRKLIQDDQTQDNVSYYARFYSDADYGTTHLAVLAKNGDAVSVTSTINYRLVKMKGGHVIESSNGGPFCSTSKLRLSLYLCKVLNYQYVVDAICQHNFLGPQSFFLKK